MSDTFREKVFWAEADDDALRMRGPDVARRSLIAYLLLGNQVVIHPAYVWQSRRTHDLMLANTDSLLSPPNVQIVLGDSPTVSEYLNDRISRLKAVARRNLLINTEYYQYVRHGTQLRHEMQSLDDRFSVSTAVHAIAWSQDKKFRHLIHRDLLNDAPFGTHLRALLTTYCGSLSAKNVLETIDRIVSLVEDKRRLTSVDSVVALLTKRHYELSRLQPVIDRLHVLHWQAHHGEGLSVPLLSRLSNASLDGNDPEVFWAAIPGLIGKEFEKALMDLPWPDVSRIILELKDDNIWQRFIGTYQMIVETIDSEDEQVCAEIIRAELDERFPSFLTAVTPRKITKLSVLSLVCGVVGLAYGVNLPGIAGVGISGLDIGNQVFAATRRYFSEDRHLIKSRIYSILRSARWYGR